MKSLTHSQIARLYEMLDQQDAAARDALARETAQRSSESYGEIASQGGDEGDRAYAQQSADDNLAMTDHLIRELDAIAQARARLDAGKFGVCVDCQCEIGFARLLACPTAQRCEHCQTLREHQYQAPHPSM